MAFATLIYKYRAGSDEGYGVSGGYYHPSITFDTSALPKNIRVTSYRLKNLKVAVAEGSPEGEPAQLYIYSLNKPLRSSASKAPADVAIVDKIYDCQVDAAKIGYGWKQHDLPAITTGADELIDATFNGLRIYAFKIDAYNNPMGFVYVLYDAPKIEIEYVQDSVTPWITYPTGTLVKGGVYRFTWEDDLDTSYGEVTNTLIQIRPSYSETLSTDLTLPGHLTDYIIDSSAIPGTESFDWRVGMISSAGTTVWTDWVQVKLNSPSLSVGDMYPAGGGKTYKGFSTVFRWALNVGAISGALSTDVNQTGAELQYRQTGGTSYETILVSGAAGTYTMGGNVMPLGGVDWRLVVHTNTGFDATSSWVSIQNVEVGISVSGLYPGADGVAPRAIDNTFRWTFEADAEDAPGAVTQTGATMYWRPHGTGVFNAVPVTGAVQEVTLRAGTLAGITAIDWYVQATATTGTSATSETVTVSTLDTLSQPVALSPIGQYLDDTIEGVTFVWEHVIQTGTTQTGWEISTSHDAGASYTVLASGSGAQDVYTSTPGIFANGTYYWRVRTKNTDGVYGEYSAPAIFAIRRAAEKPVISGYTNTALPTMRWQSAEQTGYEVEVDGVSMGVGYGSAKTWTSPVLLEDGRHTLRVRILNIYRDLSDWATVVINVANRPGTAPALTAAPDFAEVRLTFGVSADQTGMMYLLRDGEIIAKGPAQLATGYTDRTSVGMSRYVLRVFDADGHYTDSDPVEAAPQLPYGAVGAMDGSGWLLLKWSPGQARYSRSVAQAGVYRQYWGETRPRWESSGQQTVTHTVSYLYDKNSPVQLADLERLIGREVIYKDYAGHLAIGVFATLPSTAEGRGVDTFTFAVTETQREALDYGAV